MAQSCQPPEVSPVEFANVDSTEQAAAEAKRVEQAGECPAGYICAPGKAQEKCRPGFYCPNGEILVASGLGYYTEEGQTYPTPCGRGFYCPNASNTAQDRKPCRALPNDAEYSSETEWTEACGFACKQGFRLENEVCKPETTCQAGYHCPPPSQGPFGAGKCPPGFFCPAGTTDYANNFCDEGYYCGEGSDKSTGSGLCAVGYICPKGSKIATEIASGKGYFSDGRQRIACGKGLYCPKDANGPDDRQTCANKPDNSDYIDEASRTEECAFECKAGTKLVDGKCVASDRQGPSTTTTVPTGPGDPTTTTTQATPATTTTTTTLTQTASKCTCNETKGGALTGIHGYPPFSGTTTLSGYGIVRDPADCSLLVALRVRPSGVSNDQHGIGKICEFTMDWDTSFGSQFAYSYYSDPNNTASGQHIALDSSTGKIYTAGIWRPGSYGSPYELVLLRWNRDGTLDTAFGSGGRVKLAYTVAGLNKSIMTYGILVNATPVYVYGNVIGVGGAIWKFTKLGALDTNFGSSGVAIHDGVVTGSTASKAVFNSVGNILYAAKLQGMGFQISQYHGVTGARMDARNVLDLASSFSSGSVMGLLADANNDGATMLVGTSGPGSGGTVNMIEVSMDGDNIDAKTGANQSFPLSIYEPNTYVAWDSMRRPYVMVPSRFFDTNTRCFLSLRLLAKEGRLDNSWGQSGFSYSDCDPTLTKNPYRYGVDGVSTQQQMIMLMYDNNSPETMVIEVSREGFIPTGFARISHVPFVPTK